MSEYFRSLITDLKDRLHQAEDDPNKDHRLLNDARMAIDSAEQMLAKHQDCAKDRTLHLAFKADLDRARNSIRIAVVYDELAQAEAIPNIDRRLLNNAGMAIFNAEQLLSHQLNFANDGILRKAFNAHLDLAGKSIRMAMAEETLSSGYALKDGGKKGNKIAYGTQEEKLHKWADWQETVDGLAAASNLNWTQIKQVAAKKHGICEKSIQRHCANPRK